MSREILARSERFYEYIIALNTQHEDMHFVVNVIADPPTANFATIVSRKLEGSRLSARPFYDGYFPACLVMNENANNSWYFRFMSRDDAGDMSFLPSMQENFVCLSVLV